MAAVEPFKSNVAEIVQPPKGMKTDAVTVSPSESMIDWANRFDSSVFNKKEASLAVLLIA